MHKVDPHALVRRLIRSYLFEADDSDAADPHPDVGTDPDVYRGPSGEKVTVHKMSDYAGIKWKIPTIKNPLAVDDPSMPGAGTIAAASAKDVLTNPATYGVSPVTRGYSATPVPHPITRIPTSHWGTDIKVEGGTDNRPVLAVESGTINQAEPMSTAQANSAEGKTGSGQVIKLELDGGGGLVTYMHLNSIDVSVGQHVDKGQIIGRAGSTGRSTGAHLHIEYATNPNDKRTRVDPMTKMREPGTDWIFPLAVISP